MSKIRKETDAGTVKEGLSTKIGHTFIKGLRRALIIVCLESILISGFFAIMYTLKDNRSSAMEYTEEIDRAM